MTEVGAPTQLGSDQSPSLTRDCLKTVVALPIRITAPVFPLGQ